MSAPQTTARGLAAAARTLRVTSDDQLLAAWNDTLAAFLDPGSPERRQLDSGLLQSTGLSQAGLDHGLRSIGAGLLGEHAAGELARPHRQNEDGFSLVVLPAEPPGLILQSLLPALAARAPVLFKSSRAEPHFAPAFLSALSQRLPALGDAYAVATWTGGDPEVEAPLHASARLVVAYGGEETVGALQTAASGRIVTFGPKLSLGWVGPGADPERAGRGMAVDIATFDQRGCLSVHAVFAEPPIAGVFATALASALNELATELPPGRTDPAGRAGVRLAREDADLRGLTWYGNGLDDGTVILETDLQIIPSPGLRTVRVHPAADVPPLHEWHGRLQGLAIAGDLPPAVHEAFLEAGVSRFAPAGALQTTGAAWRNGGIDLAAEFAGSTSRESKLERGLNRLQDRYAGAFRRLAE